MVEPQPYWERARSIKKDRNLSFDDLVRRAPEGREVSRTTFVNLLSPPPPPPASARYPTPEMFERLALSLGCEPDEFVEYRLAKAREMLDERAVGLEQALQRLQIVEPILKRAEAPKTGRAPDRVPEAPAGHPSRKARRRAS